MSSQTEVSTSSLSAYLNDHLAGSKSAIELVDNFRADNEGTPLGEVLARLATEIDEDRGTLEDVMARLGVGSSNLKQAGGWLMERISRVRFNQRVVGSEAASRLLQLETLSLGIEGKRLLWKALQELAGAEPRLKGVDFAHLVARAKSQRKAIEPFRLEAAVEGLAA